MSASPPARAEVGPGGDAAGAALPRIVVIAAMSRDRVIGKNNTLPWRCPADLRRFKQLTTGHAIVMGRRTFESIGRPLPQRLNIVLTRRGTPIEGTEVAHSLRQALEIAASHGHRQVFVIGGEQIYRLALPDAEVIELTVIDTEVPGGDAHFPQIPPQFEQTACERHEADQKHPAGYAFCQYRRK